MKVRYRQLLLKLFVWFAAEVFLSYVGLDNLADYSEYLKEHSANAAGHRQSLASS
ncbi:MAG: hypothetical protein AAF282_19505 [Cyanobacteria bacterium P01_A01_bin.15]